MGRAGAADASDSMGDGRYIVGRGLALHIGIGCNDQLSDAAVLEALRQLGQVQIIGPDPIQGRDRPIEHMVEPGKLPAALYGQQVGYALYDSDHRTVASRIGADST